MVWAGHPCARGASARLRALVAAFFFLQGGALALALLAGAAGQGAVDAYKAAVQKERTITLPLGEGWRSATVMMYTCVFAAAGLLCSMVGFGAELAVWARALAGVAEGARALAEGAEGVRRVAAGGGGGGSGGARRRARRQQQQQPK